ncbi:AAA family ATPase [Leptolyngbya sp. NK1-12]|uniref:histidine kinase n=1 Tax=Leptolyngbya sp. NK1-12 TaxID=2547451 RepID=A0AA96WWJ4_9CYAN|nr:AAA family ATPase [Leptolyngbya sp. NK1-12]
MLPTSACPNLSPGPSPDLVGYSIVEQLYVGTRTVVYRAVQQSSQRPVIIKLLHPDYPSFNDLLQFRNQYTITKNLDIPGIVRPYSLEPYRNSYALVMEDFGGVSLRDYAQAQSLSWPQVLHIALQLSQILHHLHSHRVIHKDIKPANILFHPETQEIRLIDFSIASLLPKETQEIKNPQRLEGTLAYLAPEQTGRMNRGVDYRADFYALGVTLYELLTAELPFQTDDPLELVHCHIAKVPNLIHQMNSNVPPIISEIVAKLLAKNAEDRYQSALGLQHDLQTCLAQWQANGAIQPFVLGQQDRSERFLIPEALYGREQEVQALLAAFDRVSHGSSELLLVAGFSGIGKTAVVNEVHKPILRQRGYFVKGKFEQFNRDIPFSAFVQAFRDWVGQVLSESDAQLQSWRTKLLEALGENGQVIIDVVPELEQIIGPQPAAPELSGSAAQNRFNLLFHKFIQILTTADHPLVMFLDDLQWADSASLQLLKLLMNDSSYLLLLGAYRDNEVSPAHPFMLTLKDLKQAGAIINTITLAPLTIQDTNRLVADTLHCSTERAQPLTELIDRKTQGNPFFTTQFLKALYEEGHLTFNREQRYWECDMTQVNALSLTDDVVEFMAQRLQKLAPETQQVLQLAACIGNQFDLATLAIVSEQSPTQIVALLWEALQDGLMVPTSQLYKFFQAEDSDLANPQSSINPTYRFLHDRVQQAAYSLIPEPQKQITHLRIGRRLLRDTPEAKREERVFVIVNQLNIGRDLIDQPSERTNLARLNLIAGRKAKVSTAYHAAFTYLSVGIDLLAPDQWQTEYPLLLALHQLATEVAFLKTEFTQMERWAATVLQQAKTLLETIKIREIQIQFYQANNQLEQAVWLALEVLQQLGVTLPKQPDDDAIQSASAALQARLAGQSIESLIDLPQMTKPEILAAMRLLSCMSSSAYIAVPQLFPLIILKEIELSITYGNAPASALAYADYGVTLCGVVGDIATGYQFGNLALQLLQKSSDPTYKASTLTVVNGSIRHWQDPLAATLTPLIEAYTSGLETGDVEFAALAAHMYCYHAYLVGRELPDVVQDLQTYSEAIAHLQQKTILYFNQIYWQTVLNLMGQAEDPCCLVGDAYDEHQMLPLHLQGNNHTLLFYFYFNKASLLYLFQDYAQAVEQIVCARRSLHGVTSRPLVPLFYVYESLILLADYAEQSEIDQQQRLAQVVANQEQIQRHAQYAPVNYLHKLHLVKAEQARVLGHRAAAIDLYDCAIAAAKTNGYLQEEALANELAAKFYLDWGKVGLAADYMQAAYYGYARWGAKAKIQDLEHRYPHLLAPILQQQRMPLSATETMFAAETLSHLTLAGTQSASSGGISDSDSLDLASVLKASQTLSSEIELDQLLTTLLHTALENAGADKGALILPREDQWYVEAVASLNYSAQAQSILLPNSHEVPQSLINSVKRSLKPVVVIDAVIHPTLATDAYVVRQQPKSMLCTPILQRGELVAILYLENQATVGAFTNNRVEVLNVLCAQAAISLENARLYSRVQDSQRQLATLLSNLPGMAYSCANDADWTMKFVSEGCFTLTGYRPDELIHNRCISYGTLICSDYVELVNTAVQIALAHRCPFQITYQIRTKTGVKKWVWEQGCGVFDANGNFLSIEGLVLDISDRKAAEAISLQKSQALEQALQDLQSTQLQLVQNEKMASLGNLVAGVAHEINNPVGFLNGSINNAKDYVQDLLSHLQLYQQHYPQAVASIQDHAEQIDLDFLAADLPKLLDSMQAAIDRIKTISTSLRTFSRADTEHKVAANLHEGIDSALLILKYRLKANEQRPAIQIIQDYGELPLIECFPGQLNQVFMNVIANAIDMFDELAQQSSFAELAAKPQTITIQTAVLTNQNAVEVRIRDNGKGMTEAVKARIFDHLFTTKSVGQGTGLGLAIARQIVTETHAGSIEVQSELGQGSEFCIRLPISGR